MDHTKNPVGAVSGVMTTLSARPVDASKLDQIDLDAQDKLQDRVAVATQLKLESKPEPKSQAPVEYYAPLGVFNTVTDTGRNIEFHGSQYKTSNENEQAWLAQFVEDGKLVVLD